jgi:hypothetical protein
MSLPDNYTGYARSGEMYTVLRHFVNGEAGPHTSGLLLDSKNCWTNNAYLLSRMGSAFFKKNYTPIDALPEGLPPSPDAPPEPLRGYTLAYKQPMYFDSKGERWYFYAGEWLKGLDNEQHGHTSVEFEDYGSYKGHKAVPHPEDPIRCKAGYYKQDILGQIRYYPEDYVNVDRANGETKRGFGYLNLGSYSWGEGGKRWSSPIFKKETFIGVDPPKGTERSPLDPLYKAPAPAPAPTPQVGYYMGSRLGGYRFFDGVTFGHYYSKGWNNDEWFEDPSDVDGSDFYRAGGYVDQRWNFIGVDPPEGVPRYKTDPKRLEAEKITRFFERMRAFGPSSGLYNYDELFRVVTAKSRERCVSTWPHVAPFAFDDTPVAKVKGYKEFVFEDRCDETSSIAVDPGGTASHPTIDVSINDGCDLAAWCFGKDEAPAFVKALRKAADTLEAWAEE